MKHLITLIILLLTLTCSSCHQGAVYVKIAHRITGQVGKKLQRERGLFLVATGGRMMHDIQLMGMDFNFYSPLPIASIRPLIVYAVEEYLSAINSNEKVRPYLHNYPFTPENVEIIIYFYNRDGSFLAPGEIEIAAAEEGKITYSIEECERTRLEDVHVESFEEAVRICRSRSHSSTPPQQAAS